MCESKFTEGTTNTIDLSEESLHVVQALVAFLYGGQIKNNCGSEETLDKLNFWVELYTLAHRTMVKKLLVRAAEKFQEEAESVWDSAAFFEVCRMIYARLPACTTGLRGAVRAVVVKNLELLGRKAEFESLLQDVPELGSEVALRIAKSLTTVWCDNSNCKRYQEQWLQTTSVIKSMCSMCRQCQVKAVHPRP